MRNKRLFPLLFVVALCHAQDYPAKADELVNSYVKQGKFSGSVLVAKDGKLLLNKGYGVANIENDVPNTPQTIFRLGSITKQFTATAIMQLQEKRKLSVTDPICKYVEACPDAWSKITIRNLLTHTSGIPELHVVPSVPKNHDDAHARSGADRALQRISHSSSNPARSSNTATPVTKCSV